MYSGQVYCLQASRLSGQAGVLQLHPEERVYLLVSLSVAYPVPSHPAQLYLVIVGFATYQ